MLNPMYNSSTQDDCQGSHTVGLDRFHRNSMPCSLQQIVILTRFSLGDTTWHLTWLDTASSTVITLAESVILVFCKLSD
ncbi:Uncharacterized protein HZ326_8568 [Fusarium oxysporum f. sp. albedinis]|nr:Uncharacterized protein HZ326_8568 [Fusarium oxysporum f. sp. albedinis]